MPSRRARTFLLVSCVLAAALPALARGPEVLLPPGFGDPKAPPPPEEQPTTPPPPSPPGTDPAVPPGFTAPPSSEPPPPTPRAEPVPIEEATDSAEQDLQALPPPAPDRPLFNLPPGAVRPTDIVGVIGIGNGGFPIDAFGQASGPLVGTLVQRLDAPLPSRWASILLRRVILSRLQAPPYVNQVDWVAARVQLLLRMGEADAARLLAQAIDVDSYTPAMVRAAVDASLASADPAGLCPLVAPGRELSNEAIWSMADAMCAAMAGEQARAGTLLDQARRRGARGFDLLLAEKVVGAGSETRRSVRLRWDPVTEINPWRFGLASATGEAVPDRLLAIAGPRMQAWLARAPMVPAAQRLAAAEVAAALGIFSSASLVQTHALAFDLRETGGDATVEADSATARLETAYTGADPAARMAAMRALWEMEDPLGRYARLITTAGAAARTAPEQAFAGDADNIVASLLSAGMDNEAAGWAGVVEERGGPTRGWALLAVGAPRVVVGIDEGRVSGFTSGGGGGGGGGSEASALRPRMLAAALAGLGRIDPAEAGERGVAVGREDAWTQALDKAAADSQPGTVVLLAAVGLQSPNWSGVPPHHLYRIMRALRQVGLEFEARMIAAEALTRL